MPQLLYVEDELVIREEMQDVFEFEDVDAVCAVDGQEAWEILQNQSFDLMITDLNMPRMPGEELIKRVKTSPALAAMKVVVLSGYSREEKRIDINDLTIDDYLVKPVNINNLLAVIHRLAPDASVIGV